MIQVDLTMSSFFSFLKIPLKYIVLLIIVILLVLVNIFLLKQYLKDPVTIINKSAQTDINQKNTKDFLSFVNPKDKPNEIRAINLTIQDESIEEVVPGTRTIPISLDPSKVTNEKGTYNIVLGIDRSRLKDFSGTEQNEILNTVILMYLLSKSRPELAMNERNKLITKQVDAYIKNDSLPFKLEK